MTSAIPYDREAQSKLNKMSGMCGFRITFTNSHPNTAMPVKVMRDGASALVSSAFAIAAVTAALY
jgi:hypothetical protein